MKIKVKVSKDISKQEAKLISKYKSKGLYEDFGQKEVDILREK